MPFLVEAVLKEAGDRQSALDARGQKLREAYTGIADRARADRGQRDDHDEARGARGHRGRYRTDGSFRVHVRARLQPHDQRGLAAGDKRDTAGISGLERWRCAEPRDYAGGEPDLQRRFCDAVSVDTTGFARGWRDHNEFGDVAGRVLRGGDDRKSHGRSRAGISVQFVVGRCGGDGKSDVGFHDAASDRYGYFQRYFVGGYCRDDDIVGDASQQRQTTVLYSDGGESWTGGLCPDVEGFAAGSAKLCLGAAEPGELFGDGADFVFARYYRGGGKGNSNDQRHAKCRWDDF